MIFNPLLKVLGNTSSPVDRPSRVKDDDADPGMGSWYVGNQPGQPHTGYPIISDMIKVGAGKVASHTNGGSWSIDHWTNVGAWIPDGIEHWFDGFYHSLASWALTAGFSAVAGIFGVVAARYLIGILFSPSHQRSEVNFVSYVIPANLLQYVAGSMRQHGIRFQIGQAVGQGLISLSVPIYHKGKADRLLQSMGVTNYGGVPA